LNKNFETKKALWMDNCIPSWLNQLLIDEYYIKISLVLLALDFGSSGSILGKSLIVGWIDTPIIFIGISLIGIKIMKLDSNTSIVLSAATSICGASAANAVGSTLNASKDAITYSIAIMGIFTVPLIPLMPIIHAQVLNKFINGWNDSVCGAWIGGSIDTTGAVIASAAIVSDEAKTVAAVVKMLQNCLTGPICLGLAVAQLLKKK